MSTTITTQTPAMSFTIKFKDLAIIPVVFPSITTEIKKDTKVTTIVTATKRKNRKHGQPNDMAMKTFWVSNADQQLFKKNCVKNGKGMSEVIGAFIVAYNEGFQGDMMKRLMAI